MNPEPSKFPKQVALIAFCFYALTVAHGMTTGSLALTAKVAGWDWIPLADRPISWLLTLPFHLLPATWVPLALNLFAAALAAWTLGLIARSVELLPWSCPPVDNWAARLPALLAVVVCGLQLDFWMEATAYSGEMLDVLMLAAAVRCVLEFNAENKNRWLRNAALLWGAGMTENWVMLLTLPVFVGALVAVKWKKFLDKDFLLRTAVMGLLGCSIILLPPLVHSLNPHSPGSAGDAWVAPFKALKSTLATLYYNFWSWHRLTVIGVLLYLAVPILPCVMRMKNEDAPNLPKLERYQVRFLRTLRFLLLLVCVWLAFDPVVGPRGILRSQMGVTLPLLTLNFFTALGVAYIGGNLLFPALIRPERRSRTRLQKFKSSFRKNPAPLVALPIVVVAVALLVRNLTALLPDARPPLEKFGRTVCAALPSGGGVLLVQDVTKRLLVQSALAGRADAGRWIAVDARLLPLAQYRIMLERRQPGWHPEAGDLKPAELLPLLNEVARSNSVFYLAPHNGDVLFELFYSQPLGAVNRLEAWRENRLERASVSAEAIAAGEKFWDNEWSASVSRLAHETVRPSSSERAIKGFFRQRLALVPARHDQADFLGSWYSAALNDWGAVLQREGNLTQAQLRFAQAVALNTNNFVAVANAGICSNLLAGRTLTVTNDAELLKELRSIHQLAQVIAAFGELDSPSAHTLLGNACASAGWPRQAWAEINRAHELAPADTSLGLALVQLYSRCGMRAEALQGLKHLRSNVDSSPAGRALELEITLLEAGQWYAQTNAAEGRKILNAFAAAQPDSVPVAEAVFKAFLAFGDSTNALSLLQTQLAKNPNNLAALNNQGALLIQTHRAAEAIPVLDHALAITNLPSIRLNRAIAQMQLKNYAVAEAHYRQLANTTSVDQFSVRFGLGQIAQERLDTNAAIAQFEMALTNAPAGSLKWQEAGARLEMLKGSGSPAR